jgi:hypothetical protein
MHPLQAPRCLQAVIIRLQFVYLIAAVVVHVIAFASGAPAPRPSGTAPALFPVVVARAAFASGRWAHKGEVDGDLLLEEFCAIRVFDCFLGFVEGVVLDEDVALQ